jgi:ribose transport system substrate-binding protein
MVGSDQGMQGTRQALTALNKTAQVKIIGLGGSVAGLARVKAGTFFGEVMSRPETQGTLAAQTIVKALRTGVDSGWVNPVASLPDDGLVTPANVDKFTGEWSG